MTSNVWNKISQISGLLLLGAIFGVVAFTGKVEVRDLDLWLHLGVGKYMTEHQAIPHADFLSCSIAGKPWVNHEWLFQLILYNIYKVWNTDGILMLQVVVVTLTMLLLLFIGYSPKRQLIVSFMLFLVYIVFSQRFTLRPDIFSLFFFALYIYVLALHLDKKWALPALVIVQILWVNIHGFFFFGPLFVLIGIASEWIRRHVRLPYEWNDSGKLTDGEFRRLKWILLFSAAACLVNPYFIKGAIYPVSVFFSIGGDNKIFFKYIQELQKPILWGNILDTEKYIHYKLLIVLSFFSFIFNRRRIDISALFLWLVFLFFSLNAIRNTPFFAFAAYLVFITNIINLSYKDVVPVRFSDEKFMHMTSFVCKIAFIIWIFGFSKFLAERVYYDFSKHEVKSEFGGISLQNYPTKAVDFLVQNKIRGNFFNDFNSGAYLIGRTFPAIKVFIDGRTEVYGGKFFEEYQQIWDKGDSKLFDAKAEKLNITGAFLNASFLKIPKEIIRHLYESSIWKLVYFNDDAAIFLKDVPQNQENIKKFAIDLKTWKVEKADLYKLGPTRVKPEHYFKRADVLYDLGFKDAAIAEAQEALRITPGYADPLQLLGKIYGENKEYEKAFEEFRLAALVAPDDKSIRLDLAQSYLDNKRYSDAIEQIKIDAALWPKDPVVFYMLAEACIRTGNYQNGVSATLKAFGLNPKDWKNPLRMAEMLLDEKKPELAEVICLKAAAGNKSAEFYENAGDIFLKMGEKKAAQNYFNQALELSPENTAVQSKLKEIQKK